jgi:hypothetical protein
VAVLRQVVRQLQPRHVCAYAGYPISLWIEAWGADGLKAADGEDLVRRKTGRGGPDTTAERPRARIPTRPSSPDRSSWALRSGNQSRRTGTNWKRARARTHTHTHRTHAYTDTARTHNRTRTHPDAYLTRASQVRSKRRRRRGWSPLRPRPSAPAPKAKQ